MTKYLSSEHHFVPWDVAATNLNKLRNNLYQRPAQKNLEVRVLKN
jgi:glutamyl aminopeptidase